MDKIDRLLAIEKIKHVKARYFRCMDFKDWAGFAAVFTADAVIDSTATFAGYEHATGRWVRNGEAIDEKDAVHPEFMYRNVADFVKSVSQTLATCTTVHHGHMAEVEITSDTTAKGVWSMEDQLRWNGAGPFRTLSGYGHYFDDFEKGADGKWRIKFLRITRLRIDVT